MLFAKSSKLSAYTLSVAAIALTYDTKSLGPIPNNLFNVVSAFSNVLLEI